MGLGFVAMVRPMVYHSKPMGDEAAVEKLFAVFAATDASGAPLYPMADLAHFLPWVLVNMPVNLADLDDGTVTIFAEACGRAGVVAGDDRAALIEKFDAFYGENPPNPALVAALQAAWREVNQSAAGANPFAKFAGQRAATDVLDTGKRPEGTIPAGPMARFAKVDPKK